MHPGPWLRDPHPASVVRVLQTHGAMVALEAQLRPCALPRRQCFRRYRVRGKRVSCDLQNDPRWLRHTSHASPLLSQTASAHRPRRCTPAAAAESPTSAPSRFVQWLQVGGRAWIPPPLPTASPPGAVPQPDPSSHIPSQENGLPEQGVRLETLQRDGAPLDTVVASRPALPGDVVLRVPDRLVVTLDRIFHSASLAELLTTSKLSELACLTLYLAYEKKRGTASFWHPFIKELDRLRGKGQQGARSPILWEPWQVEQYLAGSPLVAQVNERMKVWPRSLVPVVLEGAASQANNASVCSSSCPALPPAHSPLLSPNNLKQGIDREYAELDTVWFMAGSLFNQYPYDIPTEQFTPEVFRQAFAAVQSCVVHLQVSTAEGVGSTGCLACRQAGASRAVFEKERECMRVQGVAWGFCQGWWKGRSGACRPGNACSLSVCNPRHRPLSHPQVFLAPPSRINHTPLSSPPPRQGVPLSQRFALVPLGPPLLTYSSTASAMLRYDPTSREVQLAADRAYRPGEPVLAWCGPQPNSRLLLNYGIVDEANPYDRLPLEGGCVSRGPRARRGMEGWGLRV